MTFHAISKKISLKMSFLPSWLSVKLAIFHPQRRKKLDCALSSRANVTQLNLCAWKNSINRVGFYASPLQSEIDQVECDKNKRVVESNESVCLAVEHWNKTESADSKPVEL